MQNNIMYTYLRYLWCRTQAGGEVPCKMLVSGASKSPVPAVGTSSLEKQIVSLGACANLEVLVAYEHDPF